MKEEALTEEAAWQRFRAAAHKQPGIWHPDGFVAKMRKLYRHPDNVNVGWWTPCGPPSGPEDAQETPGSPVRASGADPVERTLNYLDGLREAERVSVGVSDPMVRALFDAYPKIPEM